MSLVAGITAIGITISVKKNCDLYLKRQMRKCYANANMLLRKFVKCSPDVKCYFFKTYGYNLYCAPFWYDSTKAAMKNLKVTYSNSLRRLLGLPSHNSASVCRFKYSFFWGITQEICV